MNTKEIMSERVEAFEKLPLMRKKMILNLAQEMGDLKDLQKYIMKSIKHENDYTFIGEIADVAIVKCNKFEEAPYQAIVYNGEIWILLCSCWPTIDHALLDGIAYKSEKNTTSNFAYYAGKMINLNK